MRSNARLVCFCFILLGLASTGAFACSCIGFERPCERLGSDAIFVGRVVETVPFRHKVDEKSWTHGYSMKFAVDEVLRGSIGTEVTIETGSGGGDCGTPLEPGGRFLIFASKDKNGELWTGMCSGNKYAPATPQGEEVIREFRTAQKKGSAIIFGRINQSKPVWRDDDDAETPSRPASEIIVHAKSDQFAAVAKTAKDGSYEFNGLPNGRYKVTPQIPRTLDFDHEYEENYEADISDGQCEKISFSLKPRTRIRGHVSFPPGIEPRTIEVVALPTDFKKITQFSGKWDLTDENGRFDLWPLPPGDYFLGVNINNSPKSDAPFPPTYYPGVTEEKAAHIIHMDEGDVKDLELPLPVVAQPRIVHFVAIGLDGKPMKTIYIQLEDLRHPGDASSYVNVDLDSNGAGTVTVYTGYSYHLHGSHWVSSGNDWCSTPVVIPPGTEPVQAKFMMDRKADNCWIEEIDGLRK